MNTVLFDLDGTLLPMDQEAFIRLYFGALTQKFAPHGFEPEKLIQGLWAGMKAMQQNNGSQTNEEAFWQAFTVLAGERALAYRRILTCFTATSLLRQKKRQSAIRWRRAACSCCGKKGIGWRWQPTRCFRRRQPGRE